MKKSQKIGVESIRVDTGHVIHVRTSHASGRHVVEIISLETLGELSVPRRAVPQLIAALKRAAEKPS